MIALLAWGDQIRQPRKFVTEVEKTFMVRLSMTRREVNPIIHEFYTNATKMYKYDFSQILDSAVDFMKAGKLNSANASILNKLIAIDYSRTTLESHYIVRYFLTITLSVAFGVLGLLAVYNGPAQAFNLYGQPIAYLTVYTSVVVGFTTAIVLNLLVVYFKEDVLVRLIEEADVLIEGGK